MIDDDDLRKWRGLGVGAGWRGVYLREALVWYYGPHCGHLFGVGRLLERELKMWQCEYQSPVHDASLKLQTIMELK